MVEIIYEQPKETAKKIRNRLKREFPDFPTNHFKVRTSVYSMGSSIHVEWTDNPSYDEVTKIVMQYNSADFDGMTDSENLNGYLDEDGKRYFGAKYIFTNQEISDERDKAVKEWIAAFVEENPSFEDHFQSNRNYRKVVDYFKPDHTLKDEFNPDKVDRNGDFKKIKQELIEDMLNNFPIYYKEFPIMGVDLIGEIVEHTHYTAKVKITKKDVRAAIKKELMETWSEEKIAEEYKYVNNPHDLEERMSYVKHQVAKDLKITSELIKYLNEELTKKYTKILQKFHPIILDQFPTNWKDMAKRWNEYTGLGDFETMQRALWVFPEEIHDNPTEELQKAAVKKYEKFLEEYAKKQNMDSFMIDRVHEIYDGLHPESKQRYLKILNKNDSELFVFMFQSPYLLGSGGQEIPILKYVRPEIPNLAIYQTAFGLWAVEQDNVTKQINMQAIYRIDNNTITECIQLAKGVKNKLALADNTIVTMAEKLRMRTNPITGH